MNYLPVIAGNYVAGIAATVVESKASGDESTVFLTDLLPDDIIQAMNGPYPIYATLGCRNKGTVEYVLIKKGSYNSTNKQIILIRGQSPYMTGTGGTAIRHTSASPGGITLNFFAISPFAYRQLVDDVNSLKNETLSYITNNIPRANISTPGAVTVSYNNPSKPVNTAYQVITNDNPLLRQFIQALLGLPENSQTLKFDGFVDSSSQQRLIQLRQLFDTLLSNPSKFQNFITDFNNKY